MTGLGTGITLPPGFSFVGGSFPGTGGTLTSSLGSWQMGTMVVTFDPTAAGNYSGTMQLSYFDERAESGGNICLERDRRSASHNRRQWELRQRCAGNSASETLTVTNPNTFAVTNLGSGVSLAAPLSFAGGSYPGTGGTLGSALAAGTSGTIVLSFNPAAAGNFNHPGTPLFRRHGHAAGPLRAERHRRRACQPGNQRSHDALFRTTAARPRTINLRSAIAAGGRQRASPPPRRGWSTPRPTARPRPRWPQAEAAAWPRSSTPPAAQSRCQQASR